MLVQKLLCLKGEPFSIEDYPYLHPIYNTKAREVGLWTGRQVAKSTFLASSAVIRAVTEPGGRQVIVSPLQEQAYVFATERLKDFIHDSPLVKHNFFSGPSIVDQMLRKQFNNGHLISLGYSQRTADRLRGRSITSALTLDEIQDIFPEVIPVLKEMAFRAKNPTFWYCGTPKSISNHMEAMRSRSTSCEWAVKCPHTGCKKWNLTWDEKNIGDTGVICAHCGGRLDTNTGQWVARRALDIHKGKDAQVNMESYRIPQLIVKPVMDNPNKWTELLAKLRDYPTYQFYNEVLGLPFDSGRQPITLEELARCCVADRHNVPPNPMDRSLPPLVMGIDWAFTAESSYTFFVIGGWNPFPHKFEVYYWKKFKGSESDSLFQIQEAIRLFRAHSIKLIGADWGAGHVQNLQILNEIGEESLAQMWHTGMKSKTVGGVRAKWERKTRKWHLARTRVLTDTFESLRRQQVNFPRMEECGEFFDDIMAETMEYHDGSNQVFYTHIDPDDGLHALTFAMLAGELLLRGDFSGHGGSESTVPGGAKDHDRGDEWNEEEWGVGDQFY